MLLCCCVGGGGGGGGSGGGDAWVCSQRLGQPVPLLVLAHVRHVAVGARRVHLHLSAAQKRGNPLNISPLLLAARCSS